MNNRKVTISVIIPTYNSGTTIRKCLQSIIEQTFVDWEALVMDGASTDATIDIVKSFQESRVKIFSSPDKGVYDAMNKGIEQATGEWLYFCGSDDYLYRPASFAEIAPNFRSELDVLYGEVDSDLPDQNKGEFFQPQKDVR